MEKNKKETDFQGAVSLDAIFAATKGKTIDTGLENKAVIQKPAVKKEPEEEEVKKPVIEIKEKIIDKPIVEEQKPVVETDAFKTAKRLISLGVLKDFAIQVSDEDENGTLISELTDMSDEDLEEIVKIHNQENEKEISEKFLPKGDLKEHQLKVFEILSKGGDLSQIAETPEKALERPFEGFDMDDQKKQIDVRYTDLVHGKNLDHESAITIIEKEVKSGKIEDTSKKIFDNYREAHSSYIDDILEQQKKDKEFKDLNFKENKKLLTSKLKESGYGEAVYKKVAAEYSKKNENGDYTLVDTLREALNNPEENYDLILHLTDKNLFNKAHEIKSSNETQKKIYKLARGTEVKGNKKIQKVEQEVNETPWGKYAEAYNEHIKQK
ncbi:MAG: hypothetical protein ACJAVA_000364 [Flavobacteriaceae bacterium]|jgi:hypothetical protein